MSPTMTYTTCPATWYYNMKSDWSIFTFVISSKLQTNYSIEYYNTWNFKSIFTNKRCQDRIKRTTKMFHFLCSAKPHQKQIKKRQVRLRVLRNFPPLWSQLFATVIREGKRENGPSDRAPAIWEHFFLLTT